MYILDAENLKMLNSLISQLRNLVGFPVENQKAADIIKYKIDNITMTLQPAKMAGKGSPENPVILGLSLEGKLEKLNDEFREGLDYQNTTDEIVSEIITAFTK